VPEKIAQLLIPKSPSGATVCAATRRQPGAKARRGISKCACSHIPEIRNLFKILLSSWLHSERERKCVF